MILKCYQLTCLCLFNFVCCWLFVICLFSALSLHAIGNRHCYRVLLWLYQWPGRPVVTTSCYCLVYCAVYKSFLLWNTSRELSIGLTADILPRQRERERERERVSFLSIADMPGLDQLISYITETYQQKHLQKENSVCNWFWNVEVLSKPRIAGCKISLKAFLIYACWNFRKII